MRQFPAARAHWRNTAELVPQPMPVGHLRTNRRPSVRNRPRSLFVCSIICNSGSGSFEGHRCLKHLCALAAAVMLLNGAGALLVSDFPPTVRRGDAHRSAVLSLVVKANGYHTEISTPGCFGECRLEFD